MEIIDEKPLLLWDVIKLLEARRGASQKWEKSEQRRVYEYANLIIKLPEDKARELYEKLVNELKIPPLIAVQIVDILPLTIAEVEQFINQLEQMNIVNDENREEYAKKIRDLTREYAQYMLAKEEPSQHERKKI